MADGGSAKPPPKSSKRVALADTMLVQELVARPTCDCADHIGGGGAGFAAEKKGWRGTFNHQFFCCC